MAKPHQPGVTGACRRRSPLLGIALVLLAAPVAFFASGGRGSPAVPNARELFTIPTAHPVHILAPPVATLAGDHLISLYLELLSPGTKTGHVINGHFVTEHVIEHDRLILGVTDFKTGQALPSVALGDVDIDLPMTGSCCPPMRLQLAASGGTIAAFADFDKPNYRRLWTFRAGDLAPLSQLDLSALQASVTPTKALYLVGITDAGTVRLATRAAQDHQVVTDVDVIDLDPLQLGTAPQHYVLRREMPLDAAGCGTWVVADCTAVSTGSSAWQERAHGQIDIYDIASGRRTGFIANTQPLTLLALGSDLYGASCSAMLPPALHVKLPSDAPSCLAVRLYSQSSAGLDNEKEQPTELFNEYAATTADSDLFRGAKSIFSHQLRPAAVYTWSVYRLTGGAVIGPSQSLSGCFPAASAPVTGTGVIMLSGACPYPFGAARLFIDPTSLKSLVWAKSDGLPETLAVLQSERGLIYVTRDPFSVKQTDFMAAKGGDHFDVLQILPPPDNKRARGEPF